MSWIVFSKHVNSTPIIELDTDQWFTWLLTTESFRYECVLSGELLIGTDGREIQRIINAHIRCRRLTRSGKSYYYAYLERDGKLMSRYLGTVKAITSDKLCQTCRELWFDIRRAPTRKRKPSTTTLAPAEGEKADGLTQETEKLRERVASLEDFIKKMGYNVPSWK